jgi:hypothetical protein
MRRIVQRSLWAAFLKWRAMVHLRRRVRRHALRMQLRHQSQALQSWVAFRGDRVWLRRFLSRLFEQENMLLRRKGWNKWRERMNADRLSSGDNYYQALLEGEQKRRAAQLLSRLLFQRQARCFNRWSRGFIGERRRLRRFLLRMQKSRLAAWFHSWYGKICEKRKTKQLYQRAAAKMVRARESSVLHAWQIFVDWRVMLRHRMVLALRRWVKANQVKGFRRWQTYIRRMAEAQGERTRQEQTTRRM